MSELSSEPQGITLTSHNPVLNVYRLPQRAFDAIPGSPWVYWIPDSLRRLFEELPSLGEVAQPRQGLATADNFRFLRYWWEVGRERIGFGCRSREEARASGKRWFPYMKGGAYRKWYGNQEYVVNWRNDGEEIKAGIVHRYPYLNGKWKWVAKNTDYYFREGVTFTAISSKGFSVRYMPPGFAFDHGGNCVFLQDPHDLPGVLGTLNSSFCWSVLVSLNPTINFFLDDLKRIPLRLGDVSTSLQRCVFTAIRLRRAEGLVNETTFDFTAPPRWDTGLADLAAAQARLADLERQIDEEVYLLYDISDEDRAAIEAELGPEKGQDVSPLTHHELAVRWLSYAVGVVLGRFQPGLPGALGSAIYRRDDFAIGSLPAPDEAEFDRLVGPPERFAYVDSDGGRHLFPAEVEAALRDLAVPDGITVLDEGHPRDLPTLVRQALTLMLDEDGAEAVVAEGAGGDLRRFLERDFFTKYHFKWYRKRPVYWPLQSARRGYGFVLFHERITRMTLYVLQREYLDHKLNGLRLAIGDLQVQLEGKTGHARRQVERQIEQLTQLLDEVAEFARTMEEIVRGGYEPAPDWIDDGIILRLAPLWQLIPLWWQEPKKYWERLEQGEYDWSHIAMRYWPDRVRAKCETDRSLAIAHGHEEWYKGE